jgi:murein DD-endopeptidase MepM/ murein hydrolase activator NlpD
MYKARKFFKRLFTPVTIMLIPHDSKRAVNIRLPSIGIMLSIALWFVGSVYIVSIAVSTAKYYDMKSKLNFYTGQFVELSTSIAAIKKAEAEFKRLLSFGSREKILENVDSKITVQDASSLDMDILKDQIENTVETVEEIKAYLKEQKNIFMATPMGWPSEGRITSEFGNRIHPIRGRQEFHSAIDIAAPAGTPIRATADGVVIFAGWRGGYGNLVLIEHGFGYQTLYAHNKKNIVKEGQKVKRGDIIAYIGATGSATGPHVSYEVRLNGRAVNPINFIMEAKNVSEKK